MTAWGQMCLWGSKLRPSPVPAYTSLPELCRWEEKLLFFLTVLMCFCLFWDGSNGDVWSLKHLELNSFKIFFAWFSQMPLPSRPHWYLLFGASEDEIKDICITTLRLYTRKKVMLNCFSGTVPSLIIGFTRKNDLFIYSILYCLFYHTLWSLCELTVLFLPQPNYDQLEKEVDRRKVFLAEAKLKAKGLNPDGTPALSTLGGFSPASKPSSPNVVKVEEKSPNPQTLKQVKKEPDNRTQVTKSPHNG